MAKSNETPTKFTVEYLDESKKLSSRWHYDYSIQKNGPVLVEEFSLPKKEKRKKKKKE